MKKAREKKNARSAGNRLSRSVGRLGRGIVKAATPPIKGSIGKNILNYLQSKEQKQMQGLTSMFMSEGVRLSEAIAKHVDAVRLRLTMMIIRSLWPFAGFVGNTI